MSINEFEVSYGFYDKDFLENERYLMSFYQFIETQIFLGQFWQHLVPHFYEVYDLKKTKSTQIQS